MRRWIAIAVALVLALCGCDVKTGPERAIDKMLTALQSGDLTKAEKYTKDGALSFRGRTWKAKAFYKAMFGTLGYSMGDAETDGDDAAILLSITCADMDALVSETTLDLLDRALSGGGGFDKTFYTDITRKLEDGEIEYVTTAVTVYLVKTDKGWRVDMENSSKFADAITGGMGALLGY